VRRQTSSSADSQIPERSRIGVGALLLGYYVGSALRFAGRVGTGKSWTDTFGRELRRQLEGIVIERSAFTPSPRGALYKNAHWIKPILVAEIQFSEWTPACQVRHELLQGFRPDVHAIDVRREREQD